MGTRHTRGNAGFDAVFSAKQDRIYTIAMADGEVGETATDIYNLLKLYSEKLEQKLA